MAIREPFHNVCLDGQCLSTFGLQCITIRAVCRKINLQLDNTVASRGIEARLQVVNVFILNTAVYEVSVVKAQAAGRYIIFDVSTLRCVA